jgi:hypothetical protein
MGKGQFELQLRLIVGSEIPDAALLLFPGNSLAPTANLPDSIGELPLVVATVGDDGLKVGKPGRLTSVAASAWHPAFGWRLSLLSSDSDPSSQSVVDLAGWLAPTLHVITPGGTSPTALTEFRAALPVEQGATFTVGRSHKHCDLVLDDQHVSSEHLRIQVRSSRHYVEDLQSKWGTLIGTEPLKGERELKHGDQITIGRSKLRFECIRDALAARQVSITQVEPMFPANSNTAASVVAPKVPPQPRTDAPKSSQISLLRPPVNSSDSLPDAPQPESWAVRLVLVLAAVAIIAALGVLAWLVIGRLGGTQ